MPLPLFLYELRPLPFPFMSNANFRGDQTTEELRPFRRDGKYTGDVLIHTMDELFLHLTDGLLSRLRTVMERAETRRQVKNISFRNLIYT